MLVDMGALCSNKPLLSLVQSVGGNDRHTSVRYGATWMIAITSMRYRVMINKSVEFVHFIPHAYLTSYFTVKRYS